MEYKHLFKNTNVTGLHYLLGNLFPYTNIKTCYSLCAASRSFYVKRMFFMRLLCSNTPLYWGVECDDIPLAKLFYSLQLKGKSVDEFESLPKIESCPTVEDYCLLHIASKGFLNMFKALNSEVNHESPQANYEYKLYGP